MPSPEFLDRNERNITDGVYQGISKLGKAYSITFPMYSNAGTTEVPAVLLVNPKTSQNTVRIHWLRFWITDLTTNQEAVLTIYRNPTVGANGTAMTITSTRPSKSIASTSNAYSLPTISANGTMIMQTIATSDYSIDEVNQASIYLDPGESLLMTVAQSTAGIDYAINVSWSELALPS